MVALYEQPAYRHRYSTVPLVAIWLLVIVGLGFAEQQDLLPAWLLVALTAPAALLGLFHGVHGVMRISWASRTFAGNLPALMRRMRNLFPKLARSRLDTRKIFVHLGLAFASLGVFIVAHAYSVLPLGALFLGIVSTVVLRAVLPPGGVYLASSHPERIAYFSQLSVRTIPAIAALLEVSTYVTPELTVPQYSRRALGVLNDYRTTDPDDWPDVVKQLIEMTAIVVVDGRDDTPGLRLEVERIVRNRLEFRTLFLSTDGTIPAVLSRLNAKSSHPSGEFFVMTPEMALAAVPGFIRKAATYWVPAVIDAEPSQA